MCMEDIRIGRKKRSRVTTYTCDANGQAFIPADAARTSLLVPVSGQVAAGQPANLTAATSAANTSQFPVIAGVAGQRTTINEIVIFSSAAGTSTISIGDGTTSVNLGTQALTTAPLVFQINETFGVGLNVTISIGAAGVGVTTTVSAAGNTGGINPTSVYISDKPMNAAGQGMLVAALNQGSPVTLRVEEFGDFVYNQIFVFIAAAATIPILESALDQT